MVLQRTGALFETDLFAPLMEEVAVAVGRALRRDEQHDVAIRIVGEHARPPRSSSPTECCRRTRAAATSFGACSVASSRRAPPRRGPRGLPSTGGRRRRGVRRRVSGAAREPRLHRGGARLRGGAVLTHAASRHGALRRGVGPARRRRRRRRRRVPAVGHVRVPRGAHDRARGRRGAARRRGPVPRAAAGAEGSCSCSGQEGRDRPGHRSGPAEDLRGIRTTRGGGADRPAAERRERAARGR